MANAERRQIEAVRLWHQIAEEGSVEVTSAYGSLIGILIARGKLSAAGHWLGKARTWQQTSGAGRLDQARLNGLAARIKFKQRKFDEAIQLQNDFLSALESSHNATLLK